VHHHRIGDRVYRVDPVPARLPEAASLALKVLEHVQQRAARAGLIGSRGDLLLQREIVWPVHLCARFPELREVYLEAHNLLFALAQPQFAVHCHSLKLAQFVELIVEPALCCQALADIPDIALDEPLAVDRIGIADDFDIDALSRLARQRADARSGYSRSSAAP
jgi:hypothetical protein